MTILAIDPGNEMSGYAVMDTDSKIYGKGKIENTTLLSLLYEAGGVPCDPDYMAIEMVGSYGMAVGKTVFDTCVWIGRFIEAWSYGHSGVKESWYKVYRKAPNKIDKIDSVCMTLCKSSRAKDTNVRQAILDRYPASGGGKTPQVGTKSAPGPLYGVAGDVWSAIAVGLTFLESECYMTLTSELEGDGLF